MNAMNLGGAQAPVDPSQLGIVGSYVDCTGNVCIPNPLGREMVVARMVNNGAVCAVLVPKDDTWEEFFPPVTCVTQEELRLVVNEMIHFTRVGAVDAYYYMRQEGSTGGTRNMTTAEYFIQYRGLMVKQKELDDSRRTFEKAYTTFPGVVPL